MHPNSLRAIAIAALTIGSIARAQPAATQPAATQPAANPPATPAPTLVSKVVTIGASVTAGFGRGVNLAGMIGRAIRVPHWPVRNLGSNLFFMSPTPTGREQIDRCVHLKPTLVVGLDFLFWYTYGTVRADSSAKRIEQRVLRLRRGLRELARIDGPLVLGDLPDLRGPQQRMLRPHQIPSPAALTALNRALRTWASARKNVLIVPIADWATALKAGRLTLPKRDGDDEPKAVSARRAMMPDGLHPSRVGQVVLAGRLIERVRQRFPDHAASLSFDVWKTMKTLGLVP